MDEIFAALRADMAALTTALNRVADNQDRLIAGQAAAIEKIEGGKATTTRTRKKDDADAGKGEPAGTASPAPAAAAAYKAPVIADAAALQAYVMDWAGKTEGAKDMLKVAADAFGTATKFGEMFEKGFAPKLVFFVDRAKTLGIPAVNVKAAYDFAGDPSQDEPAATAAAEEESDF